MDQTTILEVKTRGGIMEQKKQTLRRIMDWIILWIMDWHSLENLRPVKKAKDKALA